MKAPTAVSGQTDWKLGRTTRDSQLMRFILNKAKRKSFAGNNPDIDGLDSMKSYMWTDASKKIVSIYWTCQPRNENKISPDWHSLSFFLRIAITCMKFSQCMAVDCRGLTGFSWDDIIQVSIRSFLLLLRPAYEIIQPSRIKESAMFFKIQ